MSGLLYDYEAERKLIGGLLNEGEVSDIADLVQPIDFHASDHGAAYGAIIALYAAKKDVTPASVAQQLKGSGQAAMSEEALEELWVQGLNTRAWMDVETYARTVRDHADNRRLNRTLESVQRNIRDPQKTPSENLAHAQQAIMSLVSKGGTHEIASGAEIADAAWERLQQRIKAPNGLIGLSTGFSALDRATSGLQGGGLYLIAGRTAMGKTFFALNLATHVAYEAQRPVLYVSLEMNRRAVGERLLYMTARVGKDQVDRGISQGENLRLSQAYETISNGLLYLDDKSTTPIDGITARARQLHNRSPLGLIVVDYVQLVDTDRQDGETRTLQVGAVSRKLKALALELDVPVVALAQVNRAVEARPNKRPMLSDLRESGNLEQDADCVILMYRDEYYTKEACEEPGIAEIILAKQRDGETTTVKLRYDAPTGLFYNIVREPTGVIA